MDQEAVFVIGRQELPKLLDGPLGGGMLGDVAMQNPPLAGVQGGEDVKHAKGCGDRLEEIASDDGV